MCPDSLFEMEECNRHCCPVDCQYTPWSKWGMCYCTSDGCGGGGERYNCRRSRQLVMNASCGGYCDDVSVQEECGLLCCYRDCVTGPWSAWTACEAKCEQIGTKKRTRVVDQHAECEGEPCLLLEEVAACTGTCCPVDCVLGAWSKWSACNTTCGEGAQNRTRFVQQAACGGQACGEEPVSLETRYCSQYISTNCTLSTWSAWSGCILANGFCGEGRKTRTRLMMSTPSCQGTPCGALIETGLCYGPCCRRDCHVSSWTDWGSCSASCGQGISNKTRRVTQSTDCGGTRCPSLLETRDCLVTEVIDCSFTAWSPWTACNTDCGEGVATRSRSLISPAYCGGKCMSEGLVEEKSCESYAAKQDCKASDWSEWGDCLRDCERGRQTRNRTMIANPSCGGAVCPDLTETRPCHEPCEQLCNGGVCLCRQGYTLNADHVTCTVITCVEPALDYCPPTHRYLIDCQYPKLQCSQGLTYNKTCAIFCKLTGWTLKGGVADIRCQQNATWTQPKMYCVRPNNAPLRVEIDRTHIDENKPAATCFAYLSTATTDGEQFERHTYAVVEDPTGRLHVKDNRVCLSRDSDYEETPQEWDVVFRSTDIEGLWVDTTITFHTVNHNDPPVSVKLVPDTLPENSPAGTEVGCLEGHDDDPGQNITFTLVSSDLAFHIETDTRGRQCLQLVKDSGSLCTIEGGNNCFLNFEKQAVHVITVLAVDDGTPPKSAYYEVNIYLSDVNDKQTAVSTKPAWIPEEISPGEPLVTMVTVDEDLGQTYTYRMLDDAGGLFRLVGDSLVATRRFDFETEKQLDFIVVVESVDDTNPEFRVTSNITLTVGDINEAPFELELLSLNGLRSFSKNQPSVEENIVGVFGTVTVKDYDAKDHVTIVMDSNDGMVDRLSLGETYCSSLPSLNVFCTARIDIVKPFNFEHTKVTWIVLHAVDGMRANTTLNLTLSVVDKNDPPSGILLNGRPDTVFSIAENMMDQVVSKLSAVDEDESDQHTFVVEQGPPGLFTVLGDTLKTTATARLNYERTQFYKLHIRCTDSGNPPMFALFDVTINVTDINEIPTATSLTNDKVEENSVAGTLVGELVTEDPDNELEPRQNFTYTLPDDSNGRFYLSGNKLLVKEAVQWCGAVRCTLNHELQSSLQVSVITMDTGTPKKTRTDKFTIQVLDVNDPPTHIKLNLDLVKENEPTSTVIGNFSAEDEDGKDKVSFSLVDNSDVFVILNGFTLTTKISLDYERLKSYWVTIQASDTNTPPGISEEVMKISVIDENETPIFMNMQTTINLPEDVQVGEPLKAFRISDPDSWDTLKSTIVDETDTFSITDLNCSTTLISGSTDCEFNLVLQKRLNFEIKQSYQLTLYVSDKQGLSSSSSLVVTVEDVNLAPEDITVDGVQTDSIIIKENSQGEVVATLEAIDMDKDQTHAFTIASSSDMIKAVFQIIANGLMVQQNSSLDYEVLQSEELTMNVTVTDSGLPPQTISKFFKVIVEDVNEAPTELRITNNEVSEEAVIHTSVGTLLVTDDDLDQTYTFEILGSGVFIIDGNDLVVNNALNFEKSKSHEILVEVTDSGTPPRSRVFDIQINITDVNEPPTNITISKNVVPLDSPAGTVIGTLRVIDEDEDQLHSFESVGSGEIFGVSENGELVVVNLDGLAVGEIVEIEIKVTDDGNPPMSVREVLKIQIENIATDILLTSKNTEFQFENNNVQIPERIPVETQVASVELTSNAYGDILISVVEGSELFVITDIQCTVVADETECTASLMSNAPIDFEATSTINLALRYNVNGKDMGVYQFVINVMDTNDPPEDIMFSLTKIQVKENSQNDFIGRFTVKDQDQLDKHSFRVAESDHLKVSSDGNLFTSPEAVLDYEDSTRLALTVTVSDSGNLTLSKAFDVIVLDVNDIPTKLSLTNNEIKEGASSGTDIGDFIVEDEDESQNFSLHLLRFNNIFKIENITLKVNADGMNCTKAMNCALDFETKSSYDLQVNVTDNGQPSIYKIFNVTVNVVDVNDPPRNIFLNSTIINENTPIESFVAQIYSYDDDAGQQHTFSVVGSDEFVAVGAHLITNALFNYEAQWIYIVNLTATDDGDPKLTTWTTFEIKVKNVNEPPFDLSVRATSESKYDFKVDSPVIDENVPSLTYIGEVLAFDEDDDDTLRFEAMSSHVVIRNQQCISTAKGTRCRGDMRSSHIFDFEKEQAIAIQLLVTDSRGLQNEQEVTLKMENTNDQPTNILIDGSNVSLVHCPENTKSAVLGSLTAEDEEDGQSYSFTLIGEQSFFYIADAKLWVTSAANLDYEKQSIYSLTIRVTDNGIPIAVFDKAFIIQLTDENESPTNLYLNNTKVSELAVSGDMIGQFYVEDPDKDNEDHEIRILDESVSKFEIKKHLLVVKDGSFDYENTNMYSVMFDVIDKGNPPMSATFTISVEVTDANEPPEQLKFSGNEIEENVAIGTSVGVFSARDPDIGQSLTFSIDGVNGSLSVNGVDLIVSGNIDFEANSVLKFNATVYDDGAQTMFIKKEFIIPILDVNEAPNKIRNLTVLEILESSTVSTVIATFEISDPDSVERITAKIIKGENIFDTSGLQCKETLGSSVCVVSVHLKKQLDFETNKGPTPLEFEVEDKGGLTFRKTFYFNVTNANEPPKDIIIDTEIVGIPENSPHFVVGSLVSIDDDENDKHTYQVITFWESFTTVGNKLVTKVPFDYEKKPVYELMIRSTDNGNPRMSFAKQFVINVTDVNEEPEDILVSPMKIKRNAKVGETVGVFTVIDPDNVRREGFQTHICTLASSEWLQIPQNKLHFTINKEIPPDAGTISITITCTDNGTPPLFLTQEFNLEIVDRVIPPKEIVVLNLDGGQTLLVSENENKIIVGSIGVVNQLTKEPSKEEFVFELEETTIFTIDDTTLVLKDELDFESFPEITVTIFARDAGTNGDSLNISGSFKINVMDVNEAPYGIELQGVQSVPENSLQGFAIGVLYTFDHENYQTYAYRISGVSYGFSVDENDQDIFDTFSIEGSILKVGSGYQNIDYELSDIISVLLETTDSGEPEYTLREVIHLKIEDTNDPPTEIQLTQNIIVENSPEGTVIGTLVITDPDIGQDHICEIINLIDVPFKIVDSKTLALSSQTVDFERQNTYNVMIMCSDVAENSTRLHVSKSFTINVQNVNEPPTNITLSSYKVEETNTEGQTIGEIRAMDLDSNLISFSLDPQSDRGFEIKGDATLIAPLGLDYETKRFHSIVIVAEDEEGQFATMNFEIEVLDVNETPLNITLSKTHVGEHAKHGENIGILSTVDPDFGQTFTYSLNQITLSEGKVEIQRNQLNIGENGLDFETSDTIRITIRSTDNGIPPEYKEIDFTIHIIDENDPPSGIIVGQVLPVSEDTSPHTTILTFEVEDSDVNQTHSCFIKGDGNYFLVTIKTSGPMGLLLTNELDYEENNEYQVIIACSDGEYEITKNITIQVEDVNEAPFEIKLSGSNTIKADSTPGLIIGELQVYDEDFDQTHAFIIIGEHADLLKVTDDNVLVLKNAIPEDTKKSSDPSLIFEIEVSDNGNPVLTYRQLFHLPLTQDDVLYAGLPDLLFNDVKVLATQTQGYNLGNLIANDMVKDSLEISLEENFEGLFKIKDHVYLALAKNASLMTTPSGIILVTLFDSETLESKSHRIIVEIVQSSTCETITCEHNEHCITYNETRGSCECDDDFSRIDNTCVSKDDCDGIYCQNNGTCVDQVNTFVCKCIGIYTGQYCEIDPEVDSQCNPNPCKNGGICIPKSDEFTCSCQNGWAGDTCAENIDDCQMAICYNGGTCRDRQLTYICDCTSDWKGLRCEYHEHICLDKNCNNTHGCISLALTETSLCAETNIYLVALEYVRPEDLDIEEFQARLVEFVINYGRIAKHGYTGIRRRREVIEEIEVYVAESSESLDVFTFELYVIRSKHEVLTKDAVLTILAFTCLDINSGELTEDLFCPAIAEAYSRLHEADPKASTSSSAGLIAGVIVAVAVVAAILTIVMVIFKKKNQIKPEETSLDASSRNTYASMPKEDVHTDKRSEAQTSVSKSSAERAVDECIEPFTTDHEMLLANTDSGSKPPTSSFTCGDVPQTLKNQDDTNYLKLTSAKSDKMHTTGIGSRTRYTSDYYIFQRNRDQEVTPVEMTESKV
ncbi:protocadherin Fat 4-like [Mya arenaria]|uniref:protocadherin Fat 4-like n=1 Tax=Mya arenaria TaxID=6604 RepID=UPI0022E16B83|nr:protocadherin Fat 4-like [Mya arenaria]